MRVLIFNEVLDDDLANTTITTPIKKQNYCSCITKSYDSSDKISQLEALPQEVLIRILCGVDHEDLKRLFHVSKPVREATLIARDWHFAYVTPKKAALPFPSSFDSEDSSEFDEVVDAPNAPKPLRVPRSCRSSKKKLRDLSVALFASSDGEGWRRRDKLILDIEIEI